jgi:hypothetical protein
MKLLGGARTFAFMKTSIALVGMLLLTGCLDPVRDTKLGTYDAGVGGGAGGGTAGGAGGGAGGGYNGMCDTCNGNADCGSGQQCGPLTGVNCLTCPCFGICQATQDGGAGGGAAGGGAGGGTGGAGGGANGQCDTCKGNLDCGAGQKCGTGGITCITCPCFDVCQPVGADGGVVGFIAAPAPLTEAQCQWASRNSDCANDAGTCLTLYQPTQAPIEVLTDAQLGVENYHFTPFADEDWVFFTTYRSIFDPPGVSRFQAIPALGGTLHDVLVLQQPTQRFNMVSGVARVPYGTWFVAEVSENTLTNRTLYLASFGTTWNATVAKTNVPPLTTNAVALGSDYFVGHADGVWGYYAAGAGRIAQMTGVTSVAATNAEVVFSACTATSCSVYRHDRQSQLTTPVHGPVVDKIGSVAILGGNIWALGAQTLTRIPLAPGAAEVVYRGTSFPQHAGTLHNGHLKVINGKLSFGSICEFDADAPGYGTIELDPVAKTARWVNLISGFPYLPSVVPFYGSNYNATTITGRGFYEWRVR